MTRQEYDDEPRVIVERQRYGIGAFLAGLALGAGLALLLAPQSGAELRRNIKRGARRAREAASELAEDVREKAEEVLDETREEIEERLGRAREVVREKRRDLRRAVEAGRAAAREARETLERQLAEKHDQGAEGESVAG
jgi:gas vesicle protein